MKLMLSDCAYIRVGIGQGMGDDDSQGGNNVWI